ncbi:MAG TPA: WYL domain-containing protein, partial [Myxococcota bacterium]|nr:WYL domain-containing protein [Myxococcota bacterium]
VAALRPASPARRGWRDQIEAAHRARRSVWLRYVSRDEQARPVVTLREIEPWDLRAGRVAGFCHLRGAHRVFRLDRVCGVTPGDRAYEIPRERPALVR